MDNAINRLASDRENNLEKVYSACGYGGTNSREMRMNAVRLCEGKAVMISSR